MELTLSTGVRLRVRPMPTHVYQQFMGIEEAKLDRPPDPPMMEMKSIAGHTEEVLAGEGDPGYAEWAAEMDAWTKQNQEARAKMNLRWAALMFDYGITEWCMDYDADDPQAAVWCCEAPEGWGFAPALLRAGLEPSDNPRLDYILLEVVPRPTDYGAAIAAIREDTSSITDEEVEAQVAGFRALRRLGQASGRQGDQEVQISRGDGRPKSVGAHPRSVVQRIKSWARRDDRA